MTLRAKTVTLEVLTNLSVTNLRRAMWWNRFVPEGMHVRQASADTIQAVAKKRRARRRA